MARQRVRVRVRNPKALHCLNTITMMVGTTRFHYPWAMYSPRNIQIAR
jgi:hypothetical protein